jgi:DNA-binding response OmpR family regulator
VTRILIADDHPDLLAILSARLRASGYDVVTAHNGNEALDLTRRERPALVILDVMMPELNGYQVCAKIKEDATLAQTPVILLTAKTSDADRFWGAEVGADLYLTKPASPATIVERIKELLGA